MYVQINQKGETIWEWILKLFSIWLMMTVKIRMAKLCLEIILLLCVFRQGTFVSCFLCSKIRKNPIFDMMQKKRSKDKSNKDS